MLITDNPKEFPGYPGFLFYAEEANDDMSNTWHLQKGLGKVRFIRWFYETNEGKIIANIQSHVFDVANENPTLVFGAAMFAYGLVDTINDVDMLVTAETIKKLAAFHGVEYILKKNNGLQSIFLSLPLCGTQVDFMAAVTVPSEDVIEPPLANTECSGLKVIDPFKQLSMYKALNRDKDQPKIKVLEESLQPLVRIQQEQGESLRLVDWKIISRFHREPCETNVIVVTDEEHLVDHLGSFLCVVFPSSDVRRCVASYRDMVSRYEQIVLRTEAKELLVVFLGCEPSDILKKTLTALNEGVVIISLPEPPQTPFSALYDVFLERYPSIKTETVESRVSSLDHWVDVKRTADRKIRQTLQDIINESSSSK